jgi:hypothetical protein
LVEKAHATVRLEKAHYSAARVQPALQCKSLLNGPSENRSHRNHVAVQRRGRLLTRPALCPNILQALRKGCGPGARIDCCSTFIQVPKEAGKTGGLAESREKRWQIKNLWLPDLGSNQGPTD